MLGRSKPVRQEQVDRLAAHMRGEIDAYVADGTPAPGTKHRQARAVTDAAVRNSTPEEYQAALAKAFPQN
jgi:ABC-type amino acid transport substrate-binding protein